ncbi:hypothetical protein KR093_005674 [Drosophila rubida]|uniref:Uncharacterized protein n=1 Tax=Drosophila rubida TaxID=30044 RepID=A0AAD4JZT2_9MUSC|nr:hypothetical protein KR093_005674 [Drosophila rubida]
MDAPHGHHRHHPPSISRHLPGLEEPKTNHRKVYAESSRQSVREMIVQWKAVAAQRRSSGNQKTDYTSGANSLVNMNRERRTSQQEKPKASGSRRNSTSSPRVSRESDGAVVVTRFPRSSDRSSMNATQIPVAKGHTLSYHPPVRSSAEKQAHTLQHLKSLRSHHKPQ